MFSYLGNSKMKIIWQKILFDLESVGNLKIALHTVEEKRQDTIAKHNYFKKY